MIHKKGKSPDTKISFLFIFREMNREIFLMMYLSSFFSSYYL